MIVIRTRKELREFLRCDKEIYIRNSLKKRLTDIFLKRENYLIYRFVKDMRYAQYYTTNMRKGLFYKLMYLYYSRKYNKKCVKYSLMIGPMAFDKGICIYHMGNIVVNTQCSIGENCKLHGSNCIGNSQRKDDCPTIGKNVRLGVDAKVFGDIYIANNVTIAAGAIVTKSCYEEGVTLAGVPAQIIKRPSQLNNQQ